MDSPRLTALSLFSGYGGLDLGLERALGRLGYGLDVACYVEREAYPAALLVERIEAGRLPAAPVWTDVSTFPAANFYGLVDIVTAGAPCQAFSEAARGRNRHDRDLWDDAIHLVAECRARYVFLENVESAASLRRLSLVRDDLRDLGYCVPPPWISSSAEAGFWHDRRRVFVLAHAHREGEPLGALDGEVAGVCGAATPDREGRFGRLLRGEHGTPRWLAAAGRWRTEALRAGGNGVVPAQAEAAFLSLLAQAGDQ